MSPTYASTGRGSQGTTRRAPVPEMRWIDFGLGGARPQTLDLLPDGSVDLADLYDELAGCSEVFGFEATERFFEIGHRRRWPRRATFWLGSARPRSIRSSIVIGATVTGLPLVRLLVDLAASCCRSPSV
jgi:hypothetical protein